MQLTGKHWVNANPARVWEMLMDTDTLARIVPGVTYLENTGDHIYRSILEIKLGPVSGSFAGNLQMEEIVEQKGFTLKIQQLSKIGNANAAIKIGLLSGDGDKTEVSFDGDVKLTGLLASMGQRIVGSVAGTLSKQFFSNLEKELEKKT